MRLAALLFVLTSCVYAAAPTITDLRPRGAERGKSMTLTIVGRDIPEGAKISSTLPAAFTAIVSSKPEALMNPGRYASFLVEPKPDIAPGVYPIRLETAQGLSNVLLFSVGTFPEKVEEESAAGSQPNRNDTIESAEPVPSTPIVINGTLLGAERDLYRVHGKAAEKRVIEVEARRAGSAIDPVLRILDGNGKLLARSEDAMGVGLDARLEFTFPREAYYYIEVHDARYSRQAQNYYRLKMGAYPYAEGIFPLGGKRGEVVEVTQFGGNLVTPLKASVDLGKVAATQNLTTAMPFLFAVGDLPEVVEPSEPIAYPVTINGRLNEPGERDRYRIKVQPGDKLLIETQARELGTSRLEAIVTAYDAAGKKLDSAGDKALAEDVFAVQGGSRTSNDPFLNLTVPANVNEIALAIEDLADRGGPHYGYRISVRKQADEFQLTLGSPYVNVPSGGTAVISVAADRRGYNGPIRLIVTDLPPGITQQGGYIPREYVDSASTRAVNRRGLLVLSAEPGVALPPKELIVYGEGKLEDGTIIRRQARGPALTLDVAGATAQGVVDRQRSLTAPWLGFDLPVAITDAPAAALEVKQVKLTRMEEGDRYEYEYAWKAPAGVELPKEVSVDAIGARDTRITGMQKEGSKGSFVINTTKATTPDEYDLVVRGKVRVDGRDEEIYARPLPLIVTEAEVSRATTTR